MKKKDNKKKVAFLPNIKETKDVEKVVQKISKAIKQPFFINNR